MPSISLNNRLPLPSSESAAKEEELFSSKHLRVTLRSLAAGQATGEGSRRGFALVCPISGSAWVSVQDERHAIGPGDTIGIAAGSSLQIGATEPSLVVEMEAPGPGADHFPSPSKSAKPQVTRVNALSPFSAERFVKHVLLDARDVRCDYLLMESGQSLPPHNLPCDVAFLVKEGRICVTIGSEESEAGPGDLVIVRAGDTRGIRAIEKSIVLQAVAPRPGPEMRREVAELVAPEPLRDDD